MHYCLSLVIFMLLCLINLYRSDDTHWNYRDLGPDVWKDDFPACDGRSQSPIIIKTACTIYQPFKPFHFSSAYGLIQNFTLTNNGHTISATQTKKDLFPLHLTGGGLIGTYEFVNFHLHWGANYRSGSEHQINGEKFAGEIHFVHRHTKTKELAVLGIFMQSDRPIKSNNTSTHTRKIKRETLNTQNAVLKEWQGYFATAGLLRSKDNTTVMNLKLSTLLGTNLNKFWRYSGSLTTPPCTEGIIWTIFQTPINFTHTQLTNFRTNLYFEDYRGPQPLNDRTVYRNFIDDKPSSISDYTYCGKKPNVTARCLKMYCGVKNKENVL